MTTGVCPDGEVHVDYVGACMPVSPAPFSTVIVGTEAWIWFATVKAWIKKKVHPGIPWVTG